MVHIHDAPEVHYTSPIMAILSRKTCLKALFLAVFAIQIYGATASAKKAVSVEKLTPSEIEEELQVCTLLSYADIVCGILFAYRRLLGIPTALHSIAMSN